MAAKEKKKAHEAHHSTPQGDLVAIPLSIPNRKSITSHNNCCAMNFCGKKKKNGIHFEDHLTFPSLSIGLLSNPNPGPRNASFSQSPGSKNNRLILARSSQPPANFPNSNLTSYGFLLTSSFSVWHIDIGPSLEEQESDHEVPSVCANVQRSVSIHIHPIHIKRLVTAR